MNRVTVGNVYEAARVFSGESQKGSYEMIIVQNERGKDEIVMYVNDKCRPTGITKGDKFMLNKVTEVSHGWRKAQVWNKETRQREEGWKEDFNINVDVKKIGSDLADADMSALDELDDGDLPWNDNWEENGELPL